MKLVNGRRIGRLSAPELGTVLALRKDGTVQSALVKASDTKTLGQTYQRLKMPNLGSFYKAAKVALRKAFEDSVINIFAELVRYNITSEMLPVGLTKAQKAAGACVVMPYKITDGELRSILVNGQTSDILCAADSIEGKMTLGEFAKLVVSSNGGRFQYDDKITFIAVKQLVENGLPKIVVAYSAVTLLKDSTDTFDDLGIDLKGFAVDGGKLAVKGTPTVGAFAWVHSRKDADGNLMLSSQKLIMADNEEIIDRYTSPDALRAAAESYNAKIEDAVVLEPNNAKERRILKAFGITAVPAVSDAAQNDGSILGVTYNGVYCQQGDEAPVLDTNVCSELRVKVDDITKLGSQIMCKINGATVSSPTRDGNTIIMSIPADADGSRLRVIGVADPKHTWRLEFDA